MPKADGFNQEKTGSVARRLVLLTQWYEPEPTFKGQAFAEALQSRGYDVEVVTGFPNYPGGNIYPGYRQRWAEKRVVNGVPVTRLPLYPSHDANALRRILNYSSFALSAALYLLFRMRSIDVIYVYQLPTLGFVAGFIKLIRGPKVVFDVQDLWPDTLEASGMMNRPRVLKWVDRAVKLVYRAADAVVVLSPGFRKRLLGRGVKAEKVELIYNWCSEDDLLPEQPSSTYPPFDERAFNVVFAGNLGKLQSLSTVLDAAAALKVEAPAVRIIFIGAGVELERLTAEAKARELTNVQFIPRVPMSEIGRYLRAASALLVHLKRDPLFEITIPGKTQAYMAIGKPIVMAVHGDAADLVSQANCGVCATPEDSVSIANAIMQLAQLPPAELAAMGERGSSYYQDKLSMRVGVERFDAVFRKVLHQ